jgi:predicted metal-dependent peptidase
MTNQPDLVQRVLARLILGHPFLATLALRLERVEDPTANTAWTDGVTLAINPTWFAQLGDDERVTLLAHECFHVALGHHLRRGQRELARWNQACDYAVNAILAADGFTLWAGALYDPDFGDASAEAIYARLPPQPDPAASAPRSAPAGGIDPATALPHAHPHGAGCFGEVRDPPTPTPPTPIEQANRLAQHAVLIASLAQQVRTAGKDTAGTRRAATAATEPPSVDWRALLVEFLSARHAQDYSWRRPNPRYSLLGLYLPILEATAPGKIGFVIDTSGSVPEAALRAVTGELEAYLQQYPTTTLKVVYADADVTGSESFSASDLPLRLHPVGGGGTDFGPALDTLAADDDIPACIVYLTDLKGRFPENPPPMPVIWLVFGQPLSTPRAPFGRVVVLPY